MLHHHIDQTNEDFLLNLNIRNKSVEISKKLIVNTPSPNFYINLLKKNIPFAMNKRTHGFWDALVYIEYVTKDFEKIYSSILNKNEILTLACRWMREQPQWYQRFVYIFGEGFIRECFNDLNYPNNSKNLFQAISIVGTFGQKIPDSNKLHKEKMIEIICNLTKRFNKIYDATIWKEAAYTGELLNLVKTIQDRPIIAIGPNHLKKLNERIELKNFKFVEIPNHGGAIKKRLDVFQDLNNAIKEIISINKNSHPIIILQAGCIANWLIERLFNDHKNISYLDMGLVLDVWFPEIITTKSASWGWFGQRRYLILKKMKVEKLYRKILADKFYDYFPDLK